MVALNEVFRQPQYASEHLAVTLDVDGVGEMVGILVTDDNFESRPPGTTVIKADLIKRLPM